MTKITPDSNVLIRALMNDDLTQSSRAREVMQSAAWIALPLPTLCEFVWVMRTYFKRPRRDIAMAIRTLIERDNVSVDRFAVEAGLRCLDANADFADGVIAFEGRRLGGEIFMTFDRRAAQQLKTTGTPVEFLS